jgi:hypothetical protein
MKELVLLNVTQDLRSEGYFWWLIWVNNGKTNLRDAECEGVAWMHLDPDRVQLGVGGRSEKNAPSGSVKEWKFLEQLREY